MPRIVRSILTYQNNLNSNTIYNSNREMILQNEKEKESFYTLGIRTPQKNKMSMTHSYSSPTNYLPEPINDENPKYHANAKYGASKYTCSLQSGKMHKLIRNNL
jgi:hypothetical protein